jgi:hypothetical protein
MVNVDQLHDLQTLTQVETCSVLRAMTLFFHCLSMVDVESCTYYERVCLALSKEHAKRECCII